MKKLYEEFKKFVCRGNVVDMAIGVIVGGAFSAIVTALTNNVIRPCINWLLSVITGGDGLDKVYTFLRKVTKVVEGVEQVDYDNSIFIDWGLFITKILDFFIIALTLFIVLKVFTKSREMVSKTAKNIEKGIPTKEERKILKERGVDLKDVMAVRAELIKMDKEAEEKKKAEEAAKPKPDTEISLLKDIKELLISQNQPKQDDLSVKEVANEVKEESK